MARKNRARISRLALIAVLGATLAGVASLAMRHPAQRPVLGLFTTLPIYWSEATGVADLLAHGQGEPWVRTAIERRYRLRPLDLLEPAKAGQDDPLRAYDYLLLAQPRALSPAENVALDAWVRRGGNLLLFADPMLTAQSIHPLGDARRPQDVALLSPILGHWGLRLEFDEAQPIGERSVPLFGAAVTVALAGRLVGAKAQGASCRIGAQGLVAQCRIGRGRALIVADAALLDSAARPVEPRERGLNALLDRAFGN